VLWKQALHYKERALWGRNPETQVGDKVFVLAGDSLPFILHEAGLKEVPGKRYQTHRNLIGDYNCHGIMDGEMMDENALDDIYLL
jgi:hypothetical protein